MCVLCDDIKVLLLHMELEAQWLKALQLQDNSCVVVFLSVLEQQRLVLFAASTDTNGGYRWCLCVRLFVYL